MDLNGLLVRAHSHLVGGYKLNTYSERHGKCCPEKLPSYD
jgi:hypothetical protein